VVVMVVVLARSHGHNTFELEAPCFTKVGGRGREEPLFYKGRRKREKGEEPLFHKGRRQREEERSLFFTKVGGRGRR